MHSSIRSVSGCAVLLAGFFAIEARAENPRIELREGKVVLTGLSRPAQAALDKLDAPELRAAMKVSVQGEKVSILGRSRLVAGELQFTPRFPLVSGLSYEVRSRIPGGKTVRKVIVLPKKKLEPRTELARVYPTGDRLPENLLKFYLHFSRPMSRGQAYDNIRLLTSNGKEIDYPFLKLEEELWDPHGRRFTLLFDPGRIKRELKPRLELGPVLEAGREYVLEVDSAWKDEDGVRLKSRFRKPFRVVKADYGQPAVENWKWTVPAAGTREPLQVNFGEPLDHAMLQRVLVVRQGEREVVGKVSVDRGEQRWRFAPESPWGVGEYELEIDTALEDRAGNSVGRPFEVDEFSKVDARLNRRVRRVPFRIK